MNLVSIGIAAASVVAGLAGAGVAYELATVDTPDTSATAPADAGKQTGKERVRWKPCEAPAVREGRACVTEQVRLVPVGGATATGGAAVVRRSGDGLAHDLFDDHGGDRDDAFDDDDGDFDDDDHFDDHGDDSDEDDFDDDHSSHSGGGDDSDDDSHDDDSDDDDSHDDDERDDD